VSRVTDVMGLSQAGEHIYNSSLTATSRRAEELPAYIKSRTQNHSVAHSHIGKDRDLGSTTLRTDLSRADAINGWTEHLRSSGLGFGLDQNRFYLLAIQRSWGSRSIHSMWTNSSRVALYGPARI
jgi:hypothetical protein